MNYKIIGKYIKDLNFSIPNPKTFFLLSKNIANYKINIDIKSNQIKQNIFEVYTSLSLKPTKNDFDTSFYINGIGTINFPCLCLLINIYQIFCGVTKKIN